mmetsp:Transcript_78256/g.155097  ORF Transcript_78256/g.155097 Transcript_78256/m.155097 type:complete len:90 (+) Transcript_78256:65-334(+)
MAKGLEKKKTVTISGRTSTREYDPAQELEAKKEKSVQGYTPCRVSETWDNHCSSFGSERSTGSFNIADQGHVYSDGRCTDRCTNGCNVM